VPRVLLILESAGLPPLQVGAPLFPLTRGSLVLLRSAVGAESRVPLGLHLELRVDGLADAVRKEIQSAPHRVLTASTLHYGHKNYSESRPHGTRDTNKCPLLELS